MRPLALIAAAAVIALLGACQGKSRESGRSEEQEPAEMRHSPPPAIDAGVAVAGDAGDPLPPEDAMKKPDEPEPPPDPGKTVADLGAISAWQAVVDRAQLLARRGQHGIAYGTLGPAIDDKYAWLVDDTEGNGALGIRVLLAGTKTKPGDRVALGGAWDLDADRHWFWRADSATPIPPPSSPSDLKEPRPPAPTHAIANGELPSGARTIGVAKDGDAVYFTVVGQPPAVDGDGWAVADELGNPPVALLNMPGERASYGGLDMRSSDERWQLKRGRTYWVRIGKIRKRDPDKPALINARTAPVRVK